MQNLTDQELQRLKDTTTETEWNVVCDDIKSARGGQYPPDWYQKVICTGMLGKTF